MPINLLKLIVKAEIIPDNLPPQKLVLPGTAQLLSAKDREELIQECAEQVLILLDRKTDR
jgi:hypothetical protein